MKNDLVIESNGRMAAIDGLRGLAVLAVVVYHSAIWGGNRAHMHYFECGRAGVDLFLVLSGFCLFWPLVKSGDGRVKSLKLPEYARRRIMRICPPYYAALIVVIATSAVVYAFGGQSWWNNHEPFQDMFPWRGWSSVGNLGSHLLLLHGFSNSWAHSINGVYWSLSLEWQFYFLLPLLVILAQRTSVLWAVALTFIVTVCYRGAFKVMRPDLLGSALGNDLCLARWAEFGAGMLAAYWVARPHPLFPKSVNLRIMLLIAALAVAVAGEYGHLNSVLKYISWGVAFGLLILVATMPGAVQSVLCSRPLVATGLFSYSLYLTHGPVYMLLSIPFSRWNLSPVAREWYFLLIGPPVAILLGWAFFLLFEKRFLPKPKAAVQAVRPDHVIPSPIDFPAPDRPVAAWDRSPAEPIPAIAPQV